jgi:hypothetical protein
MKTDQEILDYIKELHSKEENLFDGGPYGKILSSFCTECRKAYPCLTIQAIESRNNAI